MDEFAELYFTGANAEGYAKFRRIVRNFSLVGAAFALVGAGIAFLENTSIAFQLPFCILGVLFGIAANIVLLFKRRAFGTFFEMQRAQNALEREGEQREREERLAEGFLKTHPIRKFSSELISAVFRCASFLVLGGASVLIGTGILSQGWLILAVLLCVALSVVPGVWIASREMKERAAFYALSGKDIESVKRERLGLSEKKIYSTAVNAKGVSALPDAVELFLKEDVEREDFRSVAQKSGILSFVVGIVLGISLLLPILLAGVWEKIGSTVVWLLAGSVLLLAGGALAVFVLPLEGRKKEIYRRNLEKLTSGEADELRAALQSAWIRSQSRGNLMFLLTIILAVALGVILGLVGYFHGEALLAESLGTCILCCLIPAAIVSLIIWAVMYALYRRKVRPLEMRLKTLREEEL